MTMKMCAGYLTCLLATVFISVSGSAVWAQAPISISPKSIETGKSSTITVSSSGFFDLSKVTASEVSVNPNSGISNIQVGNATPQSLAVTLDVAARAAAGTRMLSINANDVIVSMRLAVTQSRDPNVCHPACRPPRSCEDGKCVRPVSCNPRCVSPKVCEQKLGAPAGVGECGLPR